jgi:hypothetical protein
MHDPGTDPLSPLAHRIIQEGNYDQLVAVSTPASVPALEGVSAGQLLIVPIRSELHARAMLAGLWLWRDGLEQSHRLVLACHHAPPRGGFFQQQILV